MPQYTIRNIPDALDRELRERSRRRGMSLNETAIDALKRGLGITNDAVEYDDLDDVVLLANIPAVQEFDGELKTLIILEDLNYIDMNQVEKGRMERLFGYASTHKNISVALTAQDPFRILTESPGRERR